MVIEQVTFIFKDKSKFKKHKDTYKRIRYVCNLDAAPYSE